MSMSVIVFTSVFRIGGSYNSKNGELDPLRQIIPQTVATVCTTYEKKHYEDTLEQTKQIENRLQWSLKRRE